VRKLIAAIPSLINRIHDPYSWELRRGVISSLGTIAIDKKFGQTRVRSSPLQTSFSTRKILKEVGKCVWKLSWLSWYGSARGKQRVRTGHASIAAIALNDTDKPVQIWARVALMAIDKVTEQASRCDQILKDYGRHG